MAEVPSSTIIEPDWASYQVYLKNGTEANEERNPIFNQRVKNVKMQFKLPRMDPDELYQFKDIIGRDASDFSEKPTGIGLRQNEKLLAEETKACVLATYMNIVIDEQFQKVEDEDERVYHWNIATENESNLKDRKLWEKYHWQIKVQDGEPKDLPQYKGLKDYILNIFVRSTGKLNLFRCFGCNIQFVIIILYIFNVKKQLISKM